MKPSCLYHLIIKQSLWEQRSLLRDYSIFCLILRIIKINCSLLVFTIISICRLNIVYLSSHLQEKLFCNRLKGHFIFSCIRI